MTDELAQKLAEAKKKMLGTQQPASGRFTVLVKGNIVVSSADPRADIKKID